MALGPGSIAFTGFNSDGNDNLSFVAIDAIPAGTTIYFQDNEWNGSAFNGGESAWSWTATGDVPAGTIVTIDNIGTGTVSSNLGSVAFVEATNRGVANSDEIIYAFVGSSATAPTAFLAAIANDTFTNGGGTLTGTGLTAGVNAIELAGIDADADVAAFAGSRGDQASRAAYLPIINNPANWATQDAAGDQAADGTAPDVPFSNTAFTISGTAQTVAFSAGSVNVSQAEGNSGTTSFTFVVERTGGTTGNIDFSGVIASSDTDGADFAGGLVPTAFSGIIPDGQASATVTVNVAGDTAFENNEAFTLTLQSASNSAGVPTGLGAATAASATIQNDDASGNVVGGITILDEAESLQGAAGTPAATNAIELVRLGSYAATGGNAEVVSFDPTTDRIYILNATGNKIEIVQIGSTGALTPAGEINLATLPEFGGANSVAIKNGIVAVAYGNATAGDNGHVALFDAAGGLQSTIEVGVLPDQLTFTPDGSKILVANEAEPVSAGNNPAGSISIIDVSTGAASAAVANTISFASLNGNEALLEQLGLALFPGQAAAADIEPEYISVAPDGTRAYVTLQEVNAVAVIDLTNPAADRPISILPLGGIDRSLAGNEFDGSDQDGPGTASRIQIEKRPVQ